MYRHPWGDCRGYFRHVYDYPQWISAPDPHILLGLKVYNVSARDLSNWISPVMIFLFCIVYPLSLNCPSPFVERALKLICRRYAIRYFKFLHIITYETLNLRIAADFASNWLFQYSKAQNNVDPSDEAISTTGVFQASLQQVLEGFTAIKWRSWQYFAFVRYTVPNLLCILLLKKSHMEEILPCGSGGLYTHSYTTFYRLSFV